MLAMYLRTSLTILNWPRDAIWLTPEKRFSSLKKLAYRVLFLKFLLAAYQEISGVSLHEKFTTKYSQLRLALNYYSKLLYWSV